MEFWDAIIIGAGVAGAAAAIALAQRGHRVLVVERSVWPREKACGCCMGAAGVKLLEELGIECARDPRRALMVDHINVISGKHRARVGIAQGSVMERAVLDAAMMDQACAAGSSFITGVAARVVGAQEARGNSSQATGWRVEMSASASRQAPPTYAAATTLLIADGLGGSSLRLVDGLDVEVAPDSLVGVSVTVREGGLGPHRGGQSGIDMHVGGVVAGSPSGYVGAVTLADGRRHLAAALDAGFIARSGGALLAMQRVMSQAGDMGQLQGCERLHGAGPLTRRRMSVAQAGLFVIGDAGGYVEPFTGEGMTWALAGARACAVLADGLLRRELTPEAAAQAWQAWHNSRLGRRLGWCARIRTLCRDEQSVDALVTLLKLPMVGRVASRVVAASIARPYGLPRFTRNEQRGRVYG